MTDSPSLVQKRGRLYESAVHRAGKDVEFRQRLGEAPRATLESLAAELGIDAGPPADVPIEVVAQQPDRLYLVLPPVYEPSLSDTELDRVVGGTKLAGMGPLTADAHGCPACPHTCVGPGVTSSGKTFDAFKKYQGS